MSGDKASEFVYLLECPKTAKKCVTGAVGSVSGDRDYRAGGGGGGGGQAVKLRVTVECRVASALHNDSTRSCHLYFSTVADGKCKLQVS